jgi:hypothetical protein
LAKEEMELSGEQMRRLYLQKRVDAMMEDSPNFPSNSLDSCARERNFQLPRLLTSETFRSPPVCQPTYQLELKADKAVYCTERGEAWYTNAISNNRTDEQKDCTTWTDARGVNWTRFRSNNSPHIIDVGVHSDDNNITEVREFYATKCSWQLGTPRARRRRAELLK